MSKICMARHQCGLYMYVRRRLRLDGS